MCVTNCMSALNNEKTSKLIVQGIKYTIELTAIEL